MSFGQTRIVLQGGRVMPDAFLQTPLALQETRQIVVGRGGPGIGLENGLVLRGGPVVLLFRGQQKTEENPGLLEGWIEAQGPFVFAEGLVHFALMIVGAGQEEMSLGIILIVTQGFLIKPDCAVPIAVLRAQAAEQRQGQIIILCDTGGVFKNSAGILPDGDLPRGGRQHRRDERRRQKFRDRQAQRQFSPGPDHANKQTNGRQIGVAVGEGLAAHLHQTNDRHQHAREPEPPDSQPGPTPELQKGQHKNGGQRGQSADGPDRLFMKRIRIKNGEVTGKNQEGKIIEIRNENMEETMGQGDFLNRRHRVAPLLRPDCHDTTNCAQRQERDFFHEQPRERPARQARRVAWFAFR